MPVTIGELIKLLPAETEAIVRQARDLYRARAQSEIQRLCRLTLGLSGEDSDGRRGSELKVELAAGHPANMDAIRLPDELVELAYAARYRAALEGANQSLPGLVKLKDELDTVGPPRLLPGIERRALTDTADWAAALLLKLNEEDPLTRILAVEEDILGVYSYRQASSAEDQLPLDYPLPPDAPHDEAPIRGGIRLYWGVIGLVSQMLGCEIEDLTLVVLLHELAHAYTHLGADIDRHRWRSSDFARAETALKEGLAQYYTEIALERLGLVYPGARKTYHQLLAHQPPAYHAHEHWSKTFQREMVRIAMLEMRRQQDGTLKGFLDRLANVQPRLSKKRTDGETGGDVFRTKSRGSSD